MADSLWLEDRDPFVVEPGERELFWSVRLNLHADRLHRIDSPRVGLNFDIGHAYCMGQDPEDWIERMAPHTRHYHIEDIAPSRVHAHLIPGRGAIDFQATLSRIEATGYEGWITVELYPYLDDPDQAGREAKDFLEGIIQTLADNRGQAS